MPTVPYVRQTWTDGTHDASGARMTVLENGIFEVSYAPAVRVTHTADQSITASTWTALAFNTEDFDQAGNAADTMHDNVTNNSRLTCRYAGIYASYGHLTFFGSGSGVRRAAIVKNGGAPPTPAQGDFRTFTAGNAAATSLNVSGIFALAVNDFLLLAVFQDTAGALSVAGATAADRPGFGMVRVA